MTILHIHDNRSRLTDIHVAWEVMINVPVYIYFFFISRRTNTPTVQASGCINIHI